MEVPEEQALLPGQAPEREQAQPEALGPAAELLEQLPVGAALQPAVEWLLRQPKAAQKPESLQ